MCPGLAVPFPPLCSVLCHVCCAELIGHFPGLEPGWRLPDASQLPDPLPSSAVGSGEGFGIVGVFPPTQRLLFLSLAGFRLQSRTWGLEGADGTRKVVL